MGNKALNMSNKYTLYTERTPVGESTSCRVKATKELQAVIALADEFVPDLAVSMAVNDLLFTYSDASK
jgi:hypothetical protein